MALFMVMILALSIAGCKNETITDQGKSEGGSTTKDNAVSKSSDKLTVAIWDTNQQAGLQEIMNDWSAQSGVKAEIQVLSWDEYWTLLEAGASGGSMPDVFWMHSNNSQKYIKNNLLLDLTDQILASDKIDMNHYYEDISELYAMDQKQYAMPKDIDTIALWYNKTMFDEAGVPYPDSTWTWDTLYETAKKLTKDDGSQYGYAINTGNNQDSYYNAIYAYSGKVISEDKKTSGYDDPKTIEAMEVFEKILNEGLSPNLQIMAENGADVLLKSGKVAMITQGSWMVPGFRDNEYTSENCDIAVLPKAPDGTRVSIYNGLGWAAAANGKNTDAAWSLIEYLSTKEAQLKQAELGVTMSAYKGTSEEWKNGVPYFNLQAYLDMLDATLIIRPYSLSTSIWEDMVNKELRAAWSGEATMKDTLIKIAESMNKTLAEE
ncbi:MAG: sugar ABC transporter substrate-binding protein [Firmicutes bacterium HGW-Firmicutes-3]|jgi:multiple sugar transport system substrate-binding protein|nr:MAG: sugar ABC transporter substrate-binding protein [Firmicutes bacterium HGW-Firmicutes-3]